MNSVLVLHCEAACYICHNTHFLTQSTHTNEMEHGNRNILLLFMNPNLPLLDLTFKIPSSSLPDLQIAPTVELF